MGMTSGSISDLLSRPKPWTQLSWKGRESYTKMSQFLEDSSAMEQLKAGSFNGRIAQQYSNNLQKLQQNMNSSNNMTVKDYVSRTVNESIKPNFNNCTQNFDDNSLKRKLPMDSGDSSLIMNNSPFTPSGKKIPV